MDTREPHLDAGDAEDAVFTPCIFAPGQPRDLPFADRRRLALPSRRVTLSEGDYAPDGLQGVVGIERKSGLDMLATIFGDSGLDSCGEQMANLDRFREEMRRVCAARYELFVIVSEESRGWYFAEAKRRWSRYGKAFDPFRLFDILDSFLVDCHVPTLFCGSRGLAEVDVGRILARAAGWAEGGKGWAKRARERGYAPPWYARAMPLAGAGDDAQIAAGAEEASDGIVATVETEAAPGQDTKRGGLDVVQDIADRQDAGAAQGASENDEAPEACGADGVAPDVPGQARKSMEIRGAGGVPILPSEPEGAVSCPRRAALLTSAPSPPIPVAIGQVRTSLDGRARVRILRRAGVLYCVHLDGCPHDGWNKEPVILREWPLIVDSAAPWVRPPVPPDARVSQILAGRDPLLGVAGSYSEHAAAGARKRAGRPATAARRGRARA